MRTPSRCELFVFAEKPHIKTTVQWEKLAADKMSSDFSHDKKMLQIREKNVAKFVKCTIMMATLAAVTLLFNEPAFASNYSGEIAAGSSDSFFQIGPTSNLIIDISAIGTRDPTICASCNSIYTDNYKVILLNQSGTVLESVNETNYLYYNNYSSSHGIGAGPVSVSVPSGATTLEIQSQLSIAGLLGTDGLPLNFGILDISSSGSIVAATPIPTALPLFATGLLGLILFAWRVRKQDNATHSGIS